MRPRAWAELGFAAALAVLATIYIAAGVRGVGFGSMWDEGLEIEGLKRSVQTTSFSQTGYYYGGLYYAPGYLLLAPDLLRRTPAMLEELREQPSRPFDAQRYPAVVAAQKAALADIDSPAFLEKLRKVCVAFVALSVLGVFWTSRLVTGSRWAALAAAGAVASSWELSYHGRFIAVDSALSVFCSLVLGCVCSALDTAATSAQARSRLRAAAAFAGLGLGCKLPGMFLIVPVLIGLWFSVGPRRGRELALRAVEACGLMVLVFLITTPSALLDPLHYANDFFRVESDYNLIADDYPYCEPSLGLRLAKIAGYWGLVLFSPYLGGALLATGLVLAGAVSGVRERQPKVIAVLGFLLAYGSLVAQQRLLTVRNLMVTLPPLAVLLAVGTQRAAWFLARFRGAQPLFAALMLSVLLLNLRFSWRAGSESGRTTDDSILRRFEDEVMASSPAGLYVSPALLAELKARAELPPSALGSAAFAEATDVAVYVDDLPGFKANVPRRARYFASPHANFDYYPGLLTWSGLKSLGRPVVVLSKAQLASLGVTKPPPR